MIRSPQSRCPSLIVLYGTTELRKMVTSFTMPVVKAYMQHVQDNAAESVRRVIDRLHDWIRI